MRSQKKRFPKTVVSLCLCVFVFLVVMFYAPQGFGESKTFVVTYGQGAKEIGRNLKEAGLIRSSFFFEAYVWLKRLQGNMNKGTFQISSRMSIARIVELLSGSLGEVAKVTIPEGFTAKEVFTTLEKQGVARMKDLESLDPSDFPEYPFLKGKKSLEGFLFPETFFFYQGDDPKAILEAFLDEFQKQAYPVLSSANDREFYQYLIMASITEAEVPHEEDRPVIAGILWKRLDAGIPLQVDSTLNYITGGRNASLTSEELKKDSPYNTYLYPDLPPTPIGNPGLSAARAAVNPADSPYWFFLSGADGTTHFAITFEEHKQNKARFLK